YGYARDYDLEQHYRDNRLNQIHEGTHGIQALDLLGRKVRMQDGVRLELLLGRIRATAQRALDLGGESAALGAELLAAADEMALTTGRVWEKGDAEMALANATTYLEAAGHVVLSWIWLDQFLATHHREGDFYEGKRQAARYFFAFELPKTWQQFALLSRLDSTVADMDRAWF
ncbi:MAG: acyl-CoA dehydrogenase, partial [Frankiales bacterium]|nr:acyl-CoA dehydrogenase [Frankiales bacterium]